MPAGPWFFIVFFTVALTILYGGHYFLYRCVVFFFSITGKQSKRVLAAIFAVFPLGFFVSMFFLRQSENTFSWLFSMASFLWLAYGLSLILAFELAWITWGISRLLHRRPRLSVLGYSAILLALLYSAYGVWNAYNPRIENVTVKIKNLPLEWQGKKVIQITDLHLGSTIGSEFLQGVIDKINPQEPAAVFITGDLFEGGDGNLESYASLLDGIQSETGVYYVTGNHETYLGVQRALDAFTGTQIKVLDDEIAVVNGLQIIGISYPQRGDSKDMAAAIGGLAGYDRDKPSVLLYHSPTGIEDAKAAGINLQIAGHTHCGQLFPFQLITRWIFGKYYRGLHQEGDYAIYTSCGTGTWGPMMRTSSHPEITVFHLE